MAAACRPVKRGPSPQVIVHADTRLEQKPHRLPLLRAVAADSRIPDERKIVRAAFIDTFCVFVQQKRYPVGPSEHGGGTQPVKLRNLSADGALIEADKLPIEGTSVVFCRNELCTPGHVVWVSGRYAGVAFSDKLAPEQVLRHVPSPKPKFQP